MTPEIYPQNLHTPKHPKNIHFSDPPPPKKKTKTKKTTKKTTKQPQNNIEIQNFEQKKNGPGLPIHVKILVYWGLEV